MRDTVFARRDHALYTPLCAALSAGLVALAQLRREMRLRGPRAGGAILRAVPARITETTFQDVPALALRTAALEAVVPLAYGPRVMELRPLGPRGRGENLFKHLPNDGAIGDTGVKLRGGHRLWHAPEHVVRTYQPDNAPPTLRRSPRGVSLTAAPEKLTGLQKGFSVEIAGPRTLKLTHRLANRGRRAVATAPWALTMFRRGGVAVLPWPEHPAAVAACNPAYSLVPWCYTDLSHPVWRFRRGFLAVDTARAGHSQKLGVTAYPGWSAYWLDGVTFVKFAALVPGATYPDRGSAWQVYCDHQALELETLAPLVALRPGATATHVEWWGLLEGLPKPTTEAAFAKNLVPAVRRWLRGLR